MSYNGIGLSSVRGTATSGHVQANRGHVKASRWRQQTARNTQQQQGPRYNPVSASAREKGNQEIQEHQARRDMENKLLILREDLEHHGGFSEQEIEGRVQAEHERQIQKRKRQQEEQAQRQSRP